jgi:hypothetical protein
MLAAAIGTSPIMRPLSFAQQVFRVQAGLRDQHVFAVGLGGRTRIAGARHCLWYAFA